MAINDNSNSAPERQDIRSPAEQARRNKIEGLLIDDDPVAKSSMPKGLAWVAGGFIVTMLFWYGPTLWAKLFQNELSQAEPPPIASSEQTENLDIITTPQRLNIVDVAKTTAATTSPIEPAVATVQPVNTLAAVDSENLPPIAIGNTAQATDAMLTTNAELQQTDLGANSELKAQIAALGNEQNQLLDDLAILRSQLTEVISERDSLRTALIDTAQQRDTIEGELLNLQSDYQQTLKQLNGVSLTLTADQAKFSAQQELLANLSQQRDQLEHNLHTAQQSQRQTEASVEATHTSVSTLKQELQAQQQQANNAKALISTLADKLAITRPDWARPEWAKQPASATNIAALHDTVISKVDDLLQERTELTTQLRESIAMANSVKYFDDLLPTTLPSSTASQAVPPLPKIKLQEVHFSPNSTNLTPSGQRKAKLAAEQFLSEKMRQIKVFGHTDTTGEPAYNLDLSKRRALVVAELLVKSGVPRDKIEVIGKGEAVLPEATANDIDEPLNRCVGIVGIN